MSRGSPSGSVGLRVCLSGAWCWVKLLLSGGVRSSCWLFSQEIVCLEV